jgi:hypothetical protein
MELQAQKAAKLIFPSSFAVLDNVSSLKKLAVAFRPDYNFCQRRTNLTTADAN